MADVFRCWPTGIKTFVHPDANGTIADLFKPDVMPKIPEKVEDAFGLVSRLVALMWNKQEMVVDVNKQKLPLNCGLALCQNLSPAVKVIHLQDTNLATGGDVNNVEALGRVLVDDIFCIQELDLGKCEISHDAS